MRIDNRLIHGQVTTTWVGSIGAAYLVVTNDKVSKDPVQKLLLPQAARGVPTKVLSIADTLAFVNSEEGQKQKIMIVAKFPSDALQLLDGGLKPAEINVGNQAPLPGTKFFKITNSIFLTAEDIAGFRAVAARGYKLTCKMMPGDSSTLFEDLLKKHKL
jgi:PTS system mannose-specific IIB component